MVSGSALTCLTARATHPSSQQPAAAQGGSEILVIENITRKILCLIINFAKPKSKDILPFNT